MTADRFAHYTWGARRPFGKSQQSAWIAFYPILFGMEAVQMLS